MSMKRNERVKNILSGPVITGTTNDKFSEVKHKMEENRIHHLPIVSGNKLMGIISVVDLLKVSFSNVFVANDKAVEESLDHTISIGNIMQKSVITIKEKDTIRHAAEILSTSEFNSIPVLNEAGNLVGILTSKDLINYLLDQY